MDVAGGAAFCAVVARIISAAKSVSEGHVLAIDYENLLNEISDFTSDNPALGKELCAAGAALILVATHLEATVRFAFLEYYLAASLSRGGRYLKPFSTGYLVESFSDQRKEFLTAFLHFIQGNKWTDSELGHVPKTWRLQIDVATRGDVVEYLLKNEPLCSWLIDIDIDGNEQSIISLVEARAEMGIHRRIHSQKAALAHKSLQQQGVESNE